MTEPLSTPEEMAAYEAGERRRAAEALASLHPWKQDSLRRLAETLRGVNDGTIAADEDSLDRKSVRLGHLIAAVQMTLKEFGLDQPGVPALEPLTYEEFAPMLLGGTRGLGRAKRDEVLLSLAIYSPVAFAQAVRRHRPKLLPARWQDGGAR